MISKSQYKVCHTFRKERRCYYFNNLRDAEKKMFEISYNESSTFYELVGNKFKATKSIKKKVLK